jgi:hypothetical protein
VFATAVVRKYFAGIPSPQIRYLQVVGPSAGAVARRVILWLVSGIAPFVPVWTCRRLDGDPALRFPRSVFRMAKLSVFWMESLFRSSIGHYLSSVRKVGRTLIRRPSSVRVADLAPGRHGNEKDRLTQQTASCSAVHQRQLELDLILDWTAADSDE